MALVSCDHKPRRDGGWNFGTELLCGTSPHTHSDLGPGSRLELEVDLAKSGKPILIPEEAHLHRELFKSSSRAFPSPRRVISAPKSSKASKQHGKIATNCLHLASHGAEPEKIPPLT